MVDAFGNDIAAVGIPVTGFLGFAPADTTFPTPAEGAASDFTLPIAWRKAGLITEDGGFEWTLEPDGDPIKFWQDGYQIASGLANAELVAKLAQYDNIVRQIAWGKTSDANGFITIDAGGHNLEFLIFTEEIFKNGVIRRRIASVSVTGAKLDKSERGAVNGLEVTFSAKRVPQLDNEHLGEWLIPAPSTAVPTISTALPTGKGAGEIVNLAGTGFSGATGVTFGGVASPLFLVDSSTAIRATVPPGSSGSAPVVVTTPAGASAAKTYTRVV